MKAGALALAVLMVMTAMSGCLGVDDGESDRLYVEFSEIKVDSRTIGTERCWDVTLTASRVTPDGKTMNWSMIFMDMDIRTGPYEWTQEVYFEDMTPNDPSAYDVTEPVDVEGWYIDNKGPDDRISKGDKIKITGMDRSYEGAKMGLQYGDPSGWPFSNLVFIGAEDLPETFP